MQLPRQPFFGCERTHKIAGGGSATKDESGALRGRSGAVGVFHDGVWPRDPACGRRTSSCSRSARIRRARAAAHTSTGRAVSEECSFARPTAAAHTASNRARMLREKAHPRGRWAHLGGALKSGWSAPVPVWVGVGRCVAGGHDGSLARTSRTVGARGSAARLESTLACCNSLMWFHVVSCGFMWFHVVSCGFARSTPNQLHVGFCARAPVLALALSYLTSSEQRV